MDYLRIMEEVMTSLAEDYMPPTWIFQQDNAPIHLTHGALDWVPEKSVRLMKWLSRSVDVNLIEKFGPGWL